MAGLALTILLALLWLAIVGLGYWHGGWRHVVLLAGMLLSYAVASEWTVPNGHDLATQFHWSLPRTTTAVGLLYLLGGTLVLGFLGSFALERPYPHTALERRCGAAMGVLNGGLLLALVLRTLRSYAYASGDGEVLHTSVLSRLLIEKVGYLLLVALLLGVVAVIIGVNLARRQPETVVAPAFIPADVAAPPPSVPLPLPLPNGGPVPVAPPPPAFVTPAPPPGGAPVLVYAAEPIIDWPSAPPPGTPIEPSKPAPPVAASAPPEKRAEAPVPEQPPVVIPAMPTLPRRIEPPMRYPVAELVATAAGPISTRVHTAAPVAASPPVASDAPPADTAAGATAPPPTPPAMLPPVVRPTTPPPGATQPASAPSSVARPLTPPPTAPAPPPMVDVPPAEPVQAVDSTPPVVRELTVATDDALPRVSPAEVAPPQDTPPVIREIDVTTQDVPQVAQLKAAFPPSSAAPTPVTDGTATGVPAPVSGPGGATTPSTVTETAPIPTVVPPPLPPLPPRRPAALPAPAEALKNPPPQDEPARARAGFARVAVARQAGQRPDAPPPPPPPAAPDPLRPPVPNGPRVHACPTCGYPVHNHARFCPNCGARQRP